MKILDTHRVNRRPHMIWCRLLSTALLVLCPAGRADINVSTSITLDQLQVTPSIGTFQTISPFSASAFAQVFNSLGGFDQEFNSVNDGSTSASAATAFANASAMASVTPFTLGASSGVNIPAGLNITAGTSPGAPVALLEGFFEIVNPLDARQSSVDVQWSATLEANQSLSTTGSGPAASSEVIFQLLLPDVSAAPVLFYDNLLQIGADSQLATGSQTFTLRGSGTLQTNTEYLMVAGADAETPPPPPTPEPSYLLLVGAGLSSLAVLRARQQKRALMSADSPTPTVPGRASLVETV
jgi:hypothetical protein